VPGGPTSKTPFECAAQFLEFCGSFKKFDISWSSSFALGTGDVLEEVELYLSPTSYEVQGEKARPAEKFRVTIFKNPLPTWSKLYATECPDQRQGRNRADWVSVLFSAAPILLLVAF